MLTRFRGRLMIGRQAASLMRRSPLSEMYTLSPFVWKNDGEYNILLRAVNRSENPAEKVARIYYGHSDDGVRFAIGDHPVIAPGPGEDDHDGCEDPTLAIVDGIVYVYYTGWNETAKRGQLLLASGRDVEHLEKRGTVLSSSSQYRNPKEATIVCVADGNWRLFFEYADAGASKIGMARASKVDGPWTVLAPLFEPRPGSWDSWHLSTGPVLASDPVRPVMFYNGATQDAKWRIGWIVFDEGYTRVVERCADPLIVPPRGEATDTDIAFAASAVGKGAISFLYYSIADKDMFRATVQRE